MTSAAPPGATTEPPQASPATHLSATEMARRVRAGQIDPLDLVEAHLRRIDELEPHLHAFSAVLHESARAEAAHLRGRPDLGDLPLAGVPVAIKDNLDVAGLPTTHGSAATPRTPAPEDDVIVRRLREAGALVVGKTVLPELAIWPFTESAAFPPARNPWDLSRTPGGSSGGSAVAVAARMAAVAVGSDGGGSIRIPAACCGLVGAKPAPGLVPVPGGVHWYGLSAWGSLARTVGDAALMLDVMAASDAHHDPPPPDRPLRIAASTRHPVVGARLAREQRAALDGVAEAFAAAGHHVRRTTPPYPLTPFEFINLWQAGIAQDAEELDHERLEPRTRALARRGRRSKSKVRPVPATRFAARMAGWFQDHDVLLAPILATPAVPIGTWEGKGWLGTMMGAARWMGYASLWNLAGAAAVAVPAGLSSRGLPLAVQLIGPAGSERTLLGLAAQLEQVRPWPQGTDPAVR